MQTIANTILTTQSFLTTNFAGESVARFTIGSIFINHLEVQETLLPLPSEQPADTLILEMSANFWQKRQKCPFSQILPWQVTIPPVWTGFCFKHNSSNTRGNHYIPVHLLYGKFHSDDFLFHICDEGETAEHMLIRLEYGPALHYHGSDESDSNQSVANFFQQIPIPNHSGIAGIEYWIM